MKHTPGPWEIDLDMGGYGHIINEHGKRVITVDSSGDNINEHDLPLIAAAPDMLDMLEDLIGTFENSPHLSLSQAYYIEGAKKIIAKAKGEME